MAENCQSDSQSKNYSHGIRIYKLIRFSKLLGPKAFGGLSFGPVIEPDHPDAVVTTIPYYRLKSGEFNRVPMIIGYNSMEVADFARKF